MSFADTREDQTRFDVMGIALDRIKKEQQVNQAVRRVKPHSSATAPKCWSHLSNQAILSLHQGWEPKRK